MHNIAETVDYGAKPPACSDPRAAGDVEAFLDYLINNKTIESTAAARARAACRTSGQHIDHVLIELGLLAEPDLAKAAAGFLNLELLSGHDFPIQPIAEDLLQSEFLDACGIIPLHISDETIVLATCRPLDDEAARSIGYFLSRAVELKVANRRDFEKAFERLYQPEAGSPGTGSEDTAGVHGLLADDVERLKDIAREAPVIRLVNQLINQAVELKASDIHIEPLEDHVRVRLRIDGELRAIAPIGKPMQAGVISRVKILARINIAERRLPQDGRIKLPVRGREIDFRVSTTPTLYGESVVLRILDQTDLELSFPTLGFAASDADQLSRLMSHANGIVLVTGPTGSGKTTTLYAGLTALNTEQRKIFTVEDPIEFQLAGINQIHAQPQIGLDFASALRSILRQDPDVIMVGEIRDAETARIATQASLTGHLVLSTLHTNNAAASISRLMDIGIENYLITSTLRGVIAQRLVRCLCLHCAMPVKPDTGLFQQLGWNKSKFNRLKPAGIKQPVGCAKCNNTGYKGRTTIYEIMPIDAGIQKLILADAPEQAIHQAAVVAGMTSLRTNGMEKVLAGITSIDEVLKATLVT